MLQQTLPPADEMYKALIGRDTGYEGVFIVGVTSTGIFCRPSCSARKPKRDNVEFYASSREALAAGFRPCKRCRPMESLGAAPGWLSGLVARLEAEPQRRWTDGDLRGLGLSPSRVRRWFKDHHGITFQAYSRARRLGEALGQIKQGDTMMTAFDHGFESTSGFTEAFHKLFGKTPGRADDTTRVVVNRILTPLGPMIAGATDDHLCLLEFTDRRMLETQIKRLTKRLGATFVPGDNTVLGETQKQLNEYFNDGRRIFDIPLSMPGTDFQQLVWQQLCTIEFGATRSYGEQARAVGRPTATRAVAKANGDNRIAIIVPCHRVIGADGKLTGYGGQLWRKKALLEHEGVLLV